LSGSGILRGFAEAREFLLSIHFVWLPAFWFGLVPVLLAIVEWRTRRNRRLARLGRPVMILSLVNSVRRRPWLRRLAEWFGWSAIILGLAQPQWGQGEPDGVALGRDIVLVIDLSRSMLAEDTPGPARWQSAIQAAQDLVDECRKERGHRIGVVIFAARAEVLVPLTTDYNHMQQTLAEIQARTPNPGIRPDESSVSGTRIGLGLALAVRSHDARFQRAQDIILFSDGDDPRDDQEFRRGIDTARRADIPVHVVALGNPTRESPIFWQDQLVEFRNPEGIADPVQTRLHPEVLREISTSTGGVFVNAETSTPNLREVFKSEISTRNKREFADDASPGRRNQSAWFFGFGAILFMASRLLRR
jgi:Ca-activated chloride channel homolog